MKKALLIALPFMLLSVACGKDSDHELPQPVNEIRIATYNVDGLPVSVSLGNFLDIVKLLYPPASN